MPCPDSNAEIFCEKIPADRAKRAATGNSKEHFRNGSWDELGLGMNKGTLALLINSRSQNWLPQRWKARFEAVCGGRPVVLLPNAGLDPAEVHYAAVWKPAPGDLAAFPNL